MSTLDLSRLERIAAERHAEFVSAQPFPHVVIDGFLPVELADRVYAEFPSPEIGWNHYNHYNEKKLALQDPTRFGSAARSVLDALQSDRFVRIMERLSGIQGLLSDPHLDGAGLHQILPGGFLNVHTDFLAHTTRKTWSRQLNLLLYFNRDWRPEYNGDLELWTSDMSRCVRQIAPEFNRCVVFHTMSPSFHGHPKKLACPAGSSRKSLALYYFREEHEVRRLQPTNYQPLPDDPFYKRLLISVDRTLLRGYAALKRRGIINDRMINRLLKRF